MRPFKYPNQERFQNQKKTSWRGNSPGSFEIFSLKPSVTAGEKVPVPSSYLFYLVKLFYFLATSCQEPGLLPIGPFCWHFRSQWRGCVLLSQWIVCQEQITQVSSFGCTFRLEHQTPLRQILPLRPCRDWDACVFHHAGLVFSHSLPRTRELHRELYTWNDPFSES